MSCPQKKWYNIKKYNHDTQVLTLIIPSSTQGLNTGFSSSTGLQSAVTIFNWSWLQAKKKFDS